MRVAPLVTIVQGEVKACAYSWISGADGGMHRSFASLRMTKVRDGRERAGSSDSGVQSVIPSFTFCLARMENPFILRPLCIHFARWAKVDG